MTFAGGKIAGGIVAAFALTINLPAVAANKVQPKTPP